MSTKEPSGIGETQALVTGDIEVQAPPPPPDALLGRTLDGRYLVAEKLGAGGVGAVYAAVHVDIKKPVALKVLHPIHAQLESLRLRFEREARAASQLSHPGCVSVIDFGRVARVDPADGGDHLLGMSYLVMERVRGDVLGDRIAEGRIPVKESIEIVRGVLSALRHAHGMGLVHRDVKPSNIMLSPRGEAEPWVKLLDFGLAKSVDPGSENGAPLTQAGMVFGTPGYLSPEQAGGQATDPRSDLYSVGVVLFELCCGRTPFVHTTRLRIVRDHLLTPPPPPRTLAPTLSTELEAVILRTLAKDPALRYASAEEMSAALAACPELQPAVAVADAPAPSAPATLSQRLRTIWQALSLLHRAIAVIGALIILLALGLLLRPHHAPEPLPTPELAPVAAPRGESRHLSMAIDYQRKLWCSDAIDELNKAVRDDPAVGTSAEAIDVAVGCLRNKTQDKAIRFLVTSAGPAALPALAKVEAQDSRADYRAGAARARAAILAPPR